MKDTLPLYEDGHGVGPEPDGAGLPNLIDRGQVRLFLTTHLIHRGPDRRTPTTTRPTAVTKDADRLSEFILLSTI